MADLGHGEGPLDTTNLHEDVVADHTRGMDFAALEGEH